MITPPPRSLAFSGRQIEATLHHCTQSLRIDHWSIVLNLSPRAISYRTGGTGAINMLGPFESTYVRRVRITESEQLVVLRVIEPTNIASIIFEPGWKLYADLDSSFPSKRTLWRSARDSIGEIELDPHMLTRQSSSSCRIYDVSLNLWYASSGTDCGVHQEHGFLELHTQIDGIGRMQKFESSKEYSLYEDFVVAKGLTHRTFATTEKHAEFGYPWHRYFAETGCIWMALELAEQRD